MLCSFKNISSVSKVELIEESLFSMSLLHWSNSLGKSCSMQNACTNSTVRIVRLPKPNAVISSFASGYFIKSRGTGRRPHLTMWLGCKNDVHFRNSTFQSWMLRGFVACNTPSSLSCRQASLQHCVHVHAFMCRMAVWYAKHRRMDLLLTTKISDWVQRFSALRPCTTFLQPSGVLLTDCRTMIWPSKISKTLYWPPDFVASAENFSKEANTSPPPANRFHASRLLQ